MRRRAFLAASGALLAAAPWARAAKVNYPQVIPRALVFPRDHGAHPDFRTEWWYVTGWLKDEAVAEGEAQPLGFQVTFFRARPEQQADNPSSFALRQAIFAHAALADPAHARLRHDERAARTALGLAGASQDIMRAWIDDWRLELAGSTYRTQIVASDFALDLAFEARGAPLLQGEAGLSRKGARPAEASYYYSRPQLAVTGRIERAGRAASVRGTAWLDHEWSSAYLAPEALGWDWCGINLDDGGALMAFRMRSKDAGVYWAGGTLRRADGTQRSFAPEEVSFEALRAWRSPRTGVDYPVEMRVRAGGEAWTLAPLIDDQELDARASTGTIYWEGAVRAMRYGSPAGRGHLELTGYWKPMRM